MTRKVGQGAIRPEHHCCSTTNVKPQQLLFLYTPNDAAGNLLTTTIYPDLVKGMRNQEEMATKGSCSPKAPKSNGFSGKRFGNTALRYDNPATGESRKLERRNRGPYLVSKVIGNDRYLMDDVPGSQQTQKPFNLIYASDQMKPWCDLDEDDDSEEELTEDDQQFQNGRSCYERLNDGDSITLGFDNRRGQWVAAGCNDGMLWVSDEEK
jgi:hypothetical protein